MTDAGKTSFSYEFIRQIHKSRDKFDFTAKLLGKLYAHQSVREIRRLHSRYAGFRCEYDYTKYGLFLYPDAKWNEPLLYYTGFGADHRSSVIKGFSTTVDPSARDAVRLFRNCVLPKSAWLPESLSHYGQDWNVFGTEVVAAIDNATDLTANAVVLMFMLNGVILLRMPPRRGDLKGLIERTHYSLETRHISHLPGYVSRKYVGLDPRYKRVRERAKRNARLTVAEYEAKLVEFILEHNRSAHPTLLRPRSDVWHEDAELYPPCFPIGRKQIRTIFALTYEVTLTRQGVEVENLHFNSPELHSIYRTYSGKVHVKLYPDDVRSVFVFIPQFDEPVEATLTTFELDFPISLELLKLLLSRAEIRYGKDGDWTHDAGFAVLDELRRLQTDPVTRTPGKTLRTDAQASTHATALPVPKITSQTNQRFDISALLKGSEIE
jgi:hypothetical protein